jgi:hypothetical protein
MEKRNCRNGGEASWSAVRGRGLVAVTKIATNPTTAGGPP